MKIGNSLGFSICVSLSRYAWVGIRPTATLQFIYDSIRCNELPLWILSKTGHSRCGIRFWSWCYFFLFARWMAQWMARKWDRSKGWGTKIKSERAKMEGEGKKRLRKIHSPFIFIVFFLPKCVFITHWEIYFQRNDNERQRNIRAWLSHSAAPFALLSHSTLYCLSPRHPPTKNKDETQPLNALFAEKSISGN